jgi:hypothetical protein
MGPEIERNQSIGKLPDNKNMVGLLIFSDIDISLHIPKDDHKNLPIFMLTLRMYFFTDKLRLREPCKALINMLIHNSKVPSKQPFTTLSSTPSRGENVFMT